MAEPVLEPKTPLRVWTFVECVYRVPPLKAIESQEYMRQNMPVRLGNYELLSLLGAGGMGEVYRARDVRLSRMVAIKMLRGDAADIAELRERFEREARAVASLNHPHICTLYDIGRENSVDYLVMELVEGETLGYRLEQGALPVDQSVLRCH